MDHWIATDSHWIATARKNAFNYYSATLPTYFFDNFYNNSSCKPLSIHIYISYCADNLEMVKVLLKSLPFKTSSLSFRWFSFLTAAFESYILTYPHKEVANTCFYLKALISISLAAKNRHLFIWCWHSAQNLNVENTLSVLFQMLVLES
jgi:hypothetical protein